MKHISVVVLLCFVSTIVFGKFTYLSAQDKQKIAIMTLEGKNISAMEASIVTEFLRGEIFNNPI